MAPNRYTTRRIVNDLIDMLLDEGISRQDIIDKIDEAYFECLHDMKERDTTGDWRQWIADAYHCSDCWGQKMTELEMLLELAENRRQSDPDDYVPDITLYHECTEYWNELCDVYPN